MKINSLPARLRPAIEREARAFYQRVGIMPPWDESPTIREAACLKIENQFVNMLNAILDLRLGELVYCRTGENGTYPALFIRFGEVQPLDPARHIPPPGIAPEPARPGEERPGDPDILKRARAD